MLLGCQFQKPARNLQKRAPSESLKIKQPRKEGHND